MERRPGRERKVYLKPEIDGALEAYREENGMVPVNRVLLELVGVFLEEQGYLLRGTVKRTIAKSSKEMI